MATSTPVASRRAFLAGSAALAGELEASSDDPNAHAFGPDAHDFTAINHAFCKKA